MFLLFEVGQYEVQKFDVLLNILSAIFVLDKIHNFFFLLIQSYQSEILE